MPMSVNDTHVDRYVSPNGIHLSDTSKSLVTLNVFVIDYTRG